MSPADLDESLQVMVDAVRYATFVVASEVVLRRAREGMPPEYIARELRLLGLSRGAARTELLERFTGEVDVVLARAGIDPKRRNGG